MAHTRSKYPPALIVRSVAAWAVTLLLFSRWAG